MVWSKRGAHVNPKERHVNHEEYCRDIPGHEGEKDDGVAEVASKQKCDFGAPVLQRLFAEYPAERLNVEVETLQSEDWEKQPSLTFHESFREALCFGSLVVLEHDEVGLNVGIFPDGVGVRVMPGVFTHPPGVTDAHHGVGKNPRGGVIGLPGAKDLSVGCFVGDKGELGHDHGHRRRQSQLGPGVPEEIHPGEGG